MASCFQIRCAKKVGIVPRGGLQNDHRRNARGRAVPITRSRERTWHQDLIKLEGTPSGYNLVILIHHACCYMLYYVFVVLLYVDPPQFRRSSLRHTAGAPSPTELREVTCKKPRQGGASRPRNLKKPRRGPRFLFSSCPHMTVDACIALL